MVQNRIIATRVSDVITDDQLAQAATIYKLKLIQHSGRKPSVHAILKSVGLSRDRIEVLIGQVGGTPALHRYLAKTEALDQEPINALLASAVLEAQSRLSQMGDRELVNLLDVLAKISNGPTPTTQVNVNQNSLSIDEYLASRGVIDSE